jgi:uncharacterized protein (DUF1800 family)
MDPMNDDVIRFALSRFGNGPVPDDFAGLSKKPLSGWIDEQLAMPAADDPATQSRLKSSRLRIHYGANADGKWPAVDEARPLDMLDQPIEALWPLLDNTAKPRDGAERRRPMDEVIAATYIRAVYARAQLREAMVQFWHDHFHVNANADEHIMVALPAYDRDVIRANALGNFRVMTEAVASSTAMLYYLSNQSSRAGAANENFGRELFELHTLGRDAYLNDRYDRWREVPGALNGAPEGYIDQDVYEAARAFTGWTVENGSNIDAQRKLPATGKFAYVEGWHDGYQKRVLAQEFDPFAVARHDGQKVLDLVADHPATARHLARKLCIRFVGPNPPEALVTKVAEEWRRQAKAPDQIAKVVHLIATSAEFEASRGSKVKRPIVLAAGFLRMTHADFTPTEGFHNAVTAAGQRLFGYPAPTGMPDDNEVLLGTSAVRNRWNLLLGLAQNSWQTGSVNPSLAFAQASEMTAGSFVDRWLGVFGTAADPAAITSISGVIGLPPTVPVAGLDPRRLATLTAVAAMAPAYQSA